MKLVFYGPMLSYIVSHLFSSRFKTTKQTYLAQKYGYRGSSTACLSEDLPADSLRDLKEA